MTADGSRILERTLNSGQFEIPEGRIELGKLSEVGPLNWLAHRAAGLVLGTPSVKGAEALSLNPWLLWTWLVHSAAITPLRRRRDPNIQLVILRTVWNAHGRYEWYVHFHVSRLGGVSPETIERVTKGPDEPGWTDEQRALLQAVDDIQRDHQISDVTWKELEPFLDNRRIAELFFVIGLYDHLAMLFNSVGLQPEPKRYNWAPLMLTRRPDDGDALLPDALRRVEPLLTGVLPYGDIVVGARRVRAVVLDEGSQIAIPLAYGKARLWITDLLAAGSAQIALADRILEITQPRIVDATQTYAMSARVQRLSRLMPVLIADVS
ncbi:carboxymuconolactone decarboxylase family protein [Nocardiaceae bacterium YC2-7]|uniref:Carboxymuconolactone decarboxylase family protein n=2 Tax=Antrihabitans stalactiti TaxID=2584121 RepID=A0A848KDE5_9NOCA|nr:carboxymuconolactone decarboxylase family protein [Antrihabitans stalactiti]